jgi:serine/threonine-protein kinase
MGEVYRVDDLRLGQPVALKFLPTDLQSNPDRLERLYNEVRMARQISHPNVCRVHDVGEVDGQSFLSMEYVDGENLASLLRRIGRLPQGKALEIARQLCSGLAAAHEKSVLHRDLKPENVMVDGKGQVRITDFGLSGIAGSFEGEDVRSGTPTYMSPEQLSGQAVEPRSDVYALGLVLYELFTGRRAFEGRTLQELVRKHLETPPVPPSVVAEGLDPGIERTILRCLEKDPQSRPSSARAVLAALGGADPLAAALAAGETPSPELVAAAGANRGLSARAGVLAVGGALVLSILALRLSLFTSLLHIVPLPKSTTALEYRAKSILQSLGYPEEAADQDRGFTIDDDHLSWVAARDTTPGRWDALRTGRPSPIHFWYRQSQTPMVSLLLVASVTPGSPPAIESGMRGIELDSEGRLESFYSVTPQLESTTEDAASPADYKVLLKEAGFDEATLQPSTPRWTAPFFVDGRAAWDAILPSGLKAHLEGASYRGRPVFFETVMPWTEPDRMPTSLISPRLQALQVLGCTFLVLVLGSAIFLARRNSRLGRVDSRGAARLAAYVLLSMGSVWALEAHHVARLDLELGVLAQGAGLTVSLAALVWVIYLALEPPVRRRAPLRIVSWSRLVAGQIKDPLVGRDILLGCFWGALRALLAQGSRTIPRSLGMPPPPPWHPNLDALVGAKVAFGDLVGSQFGVIAAMMGILLLVVVFQSILRREWAAAIVVTLLMSAQYLLGLGAEAPNPLGWIFYVAYGLLAPAMTVFVLLREGFLCAVVMALVQNLLISAPLTLSPGDWYSGTSLFYFAFMAGLALFGFWAARGGEPLFGDGLLAD